MAVSVPTLTYVLPLHTSLPRRRPRSSSFSASRLRADRRQPASPPPPPHPLALNFEPRRGDFLPFSTAKSSALSFAAFIFSFHPDLPKEANSLLPSSSIREQLSLSPFPCSLAMTRCFFEDLGDV